MWHWQVAWMSTELALMDTDRWHCWGYTDHQGTLTISALMIMISVHVPSEESHEERNADNRHFPVYM
ncbi:unnamed protein product [Staurois parvus]|uniref:Uncharacterized protein n=1 Tax=Staurois parvus TaxID=386267 RepID=A0ABN9BA75_9NEOB|nr:unnamed protein product [Staurois parvus]